MRALNLAHKFFGFDNSDEIELKADEHAGDVEGRDEIWLLFFVTGLSSLGFEVVQFQFEKNGNALLVVRDLTDDEPKHRAIHSSQFVYPVWMFTESKNISVEYRLRNNARYLISRCSARCLFISQSGPGRF